MSLDPPLWTFDVTTASHDDLKQGPGYPVRLSRVVISREEFPRWETAAEVAAGMAMRHGGMAIEVVPVY